MWKPRNTCFYLISQCSPSLLLITGSFVGIRRQRLILQYYFLSVHLRQTGILRYIKLSKLQSLKRRQDLSKMGCELIRAQAGRVINNKTILCKASVASVIAGNYVNETNNFSANFRNFLFHNPSNMCLLSDIYHCFLLTIASANHGKICHWLWRNNILKVFHIMFGSVHQIIGVPK